MPETTAEKQPDGTLAVVVRNCDDKTADKLRAQLATLATDFHTARGDAVGDHGTKFDEAIATALSCVDELARPHTVGYATADERLAAVAATVATPAPAPTAETES